MEINDKEGTKIYFNLKSLRLGLLASILMMILILVAYGYLVTTKLVVIDDLYSKIFTIFLFLSFVFIFLYFGKETFTLFTNIKLAKSNNPQIILSEEGIFLKKYHKNGVIPWQQIQFDNINTGIHNSETKNIWELKFINNFGKSDKIKVNVDYYDINIYKLRELINSYKEKS